MYHATLPGPVTDVVVYNDGRPEWFVDAWHGGRFIGPLARAWSELDALDAARRMYREENGHGSSA